MCRLKFGLLTMVALLGASCSQPPEMPRNADRYIKPQDRLIQAIVAKDLPGVQQALAAGCDPNLPGSGDSGILPPLHVAARHGFVEAGRLLIEHHADVNLVSVRPETGPDGRRIDRPVDAPLHVAVSFGNVEFAKLLIANKADVNARNGVGMTPLDMAVTHAMLLKSIEDRATRPEQMALITDREARNEAIITLLKANGARTTQDVESQKLDEIHGGGIIGRLPDDIKSGVSPRKLPKRSGAFQPAPAGEP